MPRSAYSLPTGSVFEMESAMGKRLNELRKRVKNLERELGELRRAIGKARKGKSPRKGPVARADSKKTKKMAKKPVVPRTATSGGPLSRARSKSSEMTMPPPASAPDATTV